MRIAIIGSGAIGCLFGAYLSRRNEVVMVCRRQETADAINRNGLTVFEPDNAAGKYKDNIRAYTSGNCAESVDLAVIIVKGADTEAAIVENMGMFTEDTLVMTLQNGAGNDLKIAQYVPVDHILIGTTRHNSVNLEKGNVRHSGSGVTHIGSTIRNDALDTVAAVFNEAGIETEVSADIQRILWSKLFVNLSINTFTAITKAPIGSMIDNDYAWFFAEKMICEAIDVAEAEGQHFSYLEVLNTVHSLCEKISTGFSSMSQDVMNCRKTEVDAINGFVVDRARVHNVPAPYNAFVVSLIHAIENTYKEQVRTMTKFAEGEVILRQGEVNDRIYKIMHGSVSLYINHGLPDEYLLSISPAGKCFAEYSCFSGSPSPFSAVANEETIVMEIPKSDIHQYLAINPRNAEEMLVFMAKQISLMIKHIELLREEISYHKQD